jgi:hypothetical protein
MRFASASQSAATDAGRLLPDIDWTGSWQDRHNCGERAREGKTPSLADELAPLIALHRSLLS